MAHSWWLLWARLAVLRPCYTIKTIHQPVKRNWAFSTAKMKNQQHFYFLQTLIDRSQVLPGHVHDLIQWYVPLASVSEVKWRRRKKKEKREKELNRKTRRIEYVPSVVAGFPTAVRVLCMITARSKNNTSHTQSYISLLSFLLLFSLSLSIYLRAAYLMAFYSSLAFHFPN